jgi:hypothetical protein
VTGRRDARAAALVGVVVFVVCCVVVRGGPFDATRYGDVHLYSTYAHQMADGKWPYGDFFDEYPPLAQPLFLGVELLPGPFPAGFKWTMVLFGAASLALLIATLAALGVSRARLFAATAVVAVAPLLAGPIFLNTYDLLPALLVAGALYALVRGRTVPAFALLALGGAAKVYPYAALPVMCIWACRRGGWTDLRRGAAAFVAATLVVVMPFAVVGAGGLRFSYRVQAERGLEIQSLAASAILAAHRLEGEPVRYGRRPPGGTKILGGTARTAAAVTSIAELLAIAAAALLYARRRMPLVPAFVTSLVAAAAFAKVFSPQYVDWLVPLVPVAGIVESIALVPALLFTRLVFDRQDDIHRTGAAVWWLLARNLWIVGLYALVMARALRSPRSSST